MANADFEQKQTGSGFSADSYRAKESQPARSLTPTQQKLAALEQKLPAGLKNQAVALALAVLVAVAGVVGIGGAKLHSKYVQVQNAFTTGVAADTQTGGSYTISAQLTARAAAAQSVIAQGETALGADSSYVQAAQAALDGLTAAQESAGPAEQYRADQALGTAVDMLYAAMQEQAADPLKMGAAQTAYSSFNSAGRILTNLSYNQLAQSYNDEASGFPANVIGTLWGCGKAELFA